MLNFMPETYTRYGEHQKILQVMVLCIAVTASFKILRSMPFG